MGERRRELFLLILGDVIVLNVSLWLTLLARYLSLPSWDLWFVHFPPFFILTGIWLLVFFTMGLYDKHTNLLKKLLTTRILYAQVVNVIIAAVSFFVLPFGITPKTTLLIFLFISVTLLGVWRVRLFPRLAPQQRHRAILIADGPEALELVDEINNNDRYNYYFTRVIDEKILQNTVDFETKMQALMERQGVDLLVADPHGKLIQNFLPSLFNLSFLRFACTFIDFYKLYADTFDRVPVRMLRYEWFISNISQSRAVVHDALKRSVDVVGAIALLVPTALLTPLIALAIKLDDGGSVFYTSIRVGQYNKPIKLYKFRTKNGRDKGGEALKSVLVDTKVGTFLRKTRLDELPQLLNVLRGDLSFIGPRPEMPALAEVYAQKIPYYNARHFLKPGLSGWAQVSNYDVPRGGVDVERTTTKLSYDLFYLERRSLRFDLHIALKTIATLIMRTGS